MRSVADQLRLETRARVLDLPVMARIALSLRLGDEDVALYSAHVNLDPHEARRRLHAQRAHGRRDARVARLDADDAARSSR
jgi:hypothetical protein